MPEPKPRSQPWRASPRQLRGARKINSPASDRTASKLGPFSRWRYTNGSNPASSSSESFANLTSSWRSPTWEHSAIRVSERRRKDRDRSASPQRSRTALGLGIPSWNIRSSARRHSADRRKPGAGSPSRPPASSPLSRPRLPNKGVVPFLHASARLGRHRRIGCSGVHLIPQQGLTGVVAIPIQRRRPHWREASRIESTPADRQGTSARLW